MSLGNEEKQASDQPAETNNGSEKKQAKSYTRDFLLSLSELEICKKLPTGFDQSVLSEFGDASQERQRASCSSSLLNFRRHEYGTSPPTRGDVGSYFRSSHGRWDSHPSGRNDRDSDSQSDKDSDSGRHYINHSRRPWPVPDPEHDGLLGSGSVLRPSGYAGGASAPKLRASDHYQLNKSNEPYHPPRPYKAAPHLRRDTKDSFNDETFGSSDWTSEDRAEEERKRRASFELLRKEQHKSLQESQMLPERCKHDFDITELLEDSKDEKRLVTKSRESDEVSLQQASNHGSARSTLPQHISASRPLVPPGFMGSSSEKKILTKNPTQSQSSQVRSSELEANFSSSQRGFLDKLSRLSVELAVSDQSENQIVNISDESKSDKRKAMKSPSELDVSSKMVGMTEELDGNNIPGETSILNTFFGDAVVLNEGGSSYFYKEPNSGADDISAPNNVQSSKFARWFLEGERKPVDDISSGLSNDLLSLIQHGGKDSSQVYDAIPSNHVLPELSVESSEHVDTRLAPNLTSVDAEKPEQRNNIKPEVARAVLTCEDLEKSILLGGSGNPTSPPALLNQDIAYVKGKQKSHYDDHASQHLLSLLQRGDGENQVSSASIGIRSSKPSDDSQAMDQVVAPVDLKELNAETAPSSGQTLTLEALFGSAFMKELQSVGGSTSFLGDLAGSGRRELLDPNVSSTGVADNGFSPALGSNQTASRASVFPFSQLENCKSDVIEQHLLGFSSQLPAGDTYSRKPAKGEILSSSETAVSITGKLGASDSVFRDERPGTGSRGHSPFLHSPYDARGVDIAPEVQESSSQHLPQVNQGPFFHHLDSKDAIIASRREFVSPEGVIDHEPQRHQFPLSILHPPFPHPSGRLSAFDLHIDHPVLQQIHALGVPPLQMQPGFSGGAPVPHRSNQVTGLRQDLNPMQGFPLLHQQPNNGLAIEPGHNARYGGNQPEGLQRHIEMELRSSIKQKQQFGSGHSQGMYGPELEMGFGYR